jgi:hypothetical protein
VSRWTRAALGLTAPLWALGVAAAAPASPALLWRVPASAEVLWRGLLKNEGAAVGAGQQIGLYPAPSVVGLLAGILTHAAVAQGVQSAQRKREQDEADKVLTSYAEALKAWPASSLWEAAAGSRDLLWDGNTAAPKGSVELQPVFSLTQDEAAVVLDVAVTITPAVGMPPEQTLVRVVSTPLGVTDMRAYWAADGAQRLKSAAAALLAHAVVIAGQHGAAASGAAVEWLPAARTFRYRQGSGERFERAQPVATMCARAVLRTLRGTLLSVPVAAEGCVPDVTF